MYLLSLFFVLISYLCDISYRNGTKKNALSVGTTTVPDKQTVKIDLSTPLWQLTAGDLLNLLDHGNKPVITIDTTKDKRFVYGLVGIA